MKCEKTPIDPTETLEIGLSFLSELGRNPLIPKKQKM
jgi:hypothetical protein